MQLAKLNKGQISLDSLIALSIYIVAFSFLFFLSSKIATLFSSTIESFFYEIQLYYIGLSLDTASYSLINTKADLNFPIIISSNATKIYATISEKPAPSPSNTYKTVSNISCSLLNQITLDPEGGFYVQSKKKKPS
jgi:hypothetical protein